MVAMATPTIVPIEFVRPGRIVVEPRKAAVRAGSRYSGPMLDWATPEEREEMSTPATATSTPDATIAPTTYLRRGIPVSSAARGFAPTA